MRLPEYIPVIGVEPGATARSDMGTLLYPLPPKSGYARDDREMVVVNCVRKEMHFVVGREVVRFSAFVPDDMTKDQAAEAFTHLVLDALRSANLGVLQ